MRASIIIPVWNGADVLPACLDSIQEQAGAELLEVICVDNASEDTSADLIAGYYPQVRLLHQAVNLGFAGGVNAGIDAAQGNVMVLLNQDCIAQPGWLKALDRALASHPKLGVAGCTLYTNDGNIGHVGAIIQRPEAYGVHLAQIPQAELIESDFVTGAAMAISRRTLEATGPFDEGFYPGYYEDADYCYRVRRQGFSVACVINARVVHLAQSKEWQADTTKHYANQCLSRYRFVAKHFDSQETIEFFAAELEAANTEEYLDRAIGRAIAARDVLRQLPDVLHRRSLDLEDPLSAAHRRQLQVGFARVWRQGYAAAQKLVRVGLIPSPSEQRQATDSRPPKGLSMPMQGGMCTLEGMKAAHEAELQKLDEQEYRVLRRLYPLGFSPGGRGTRLQQLGYRLQSLWRALTGYNERLQAELQAVRTARAACLQEELERRLRLLETLTDYDYH